MTDTFDLNTIEGRALARAAGLCVPADELLSGLENPPPDVSEESEKQFQSRVVKLAVERGWRKYHVHFSQRSDPGWPDLILLRGRRQIAAELKVGKNKLTPEQQDWLRAFADARVETHLWTPGMWDEIVKTLE